MAYTDLPLAELLTYLPEIAEPSDFDEFWHHTLSSARSSARIVDATVTRHASALSLIEAYDVRFPGWGGDPIAGWLLLPARKTGPLPAVIEYNGYGGGRGLAHERLAWVASGYAYLFMDTRAQGSLWGTGGETPDPHGTGPSVPGFATRGIETRDDYYYRRVFTDAVRAVDFMRSRQEIDGDRIAVTGTSQGGGIALAVGGLVPDLAAVMPDVPFLCHFERAITITNEDPYDEIRRYLSVHRNAESAVLSTLSYFDGVSFARRSHAPSLFSVGLMDPVCPPSTVFAAFNNYAGTKTIETYPYNEHEGGQGFQFEKQATLLQSLFGA